jgi:hypothetical protein
MVFTSEHKKLIIESYISNCIFNNGERTYTDVAWLAEYLKKIPNLN